MQLSPQPEDSKETYDWKSVNNHECELVMAYDTNAENNILYSRLFYVLYIGPNNNSIGHLIFRLLTKDILTTIKYQPVPMLEDLIKAINETDSFTNKIQINYFDGEHLTAKDDHTNNDKVDGQT